MPVFLEIRAIYSQIPALLFLAEARIMCEALWSFGFLVHPVEAIQLASEHGRKSKACSLGMIESQSRAAWALSAAWGPSDF